MLSLRVTSSALICPMGLRLLLVLLLDVLNLALQKIDLILDRYELRVLWLPDLASFSQQGTRAA